MRSKKSRALTCKTLIDDIDLFRVLAPFYIFVFCFKNIMKTSSDLNEWTETFPQRTPIVSFEKENHVGSFTIHVVHHSATHKWDPLWCPIMWKVMTVKKISGTKTIAPQEYFLECQLARALKRLPIFYLMVDSLCRLSLSLSRSLGRLLSVWRRWQMTRRRSKSRRSGYG